MASEKRNDSVEPSESAAGAGEGGGGTEQKRRWEAWGNHPPDDNVPEENLARLNTHALRPKGEPRPNPTDFSVSLRAKYGTDQLLHHPGARTQTMRGFESTYVDIIDFIVRATHRIWEEKDVGYIYDHYRHNIRVVDDTGLVVGRDAVIANTLGFINAFPDIRIVADEIVWAGNDTVGFHTSHRAFVTGTNTGHSAYGPPTGRRVHFWLIANCIFVANENVEEWVIYNTSSMLKQLGFDVKQKACVSSGRDENGLEHGFGEPERLLGQGKPRHLPPSEARSFDVEQFIRSMYHYVWNWRMLGRMHEHYAPNVRFFGPTDLVRHGLGDVQSYVLSLLAMFPDLALTIDDLYWMGNDAEGYVAATRWSVVGSHRGFGVYGPPTGRRVHLWGITHHHISGGKITEEWMMFNEFDVMGQIYRDAAPSAPQEPDAPTGLL